MKFLENEYQHCLDNQYFITAEYGMEKAREYSKFLGNLKQCLLLLRLADADRH